MCPQRLGQCSVALLLASFCGVARGQESHESFTCDQWVRTPLSGAGGVPHCGPWIRDGYVSIQVNVDKRGCNIVGDAANEPSIAVDPNDPRRIAIGWRQFDSVESDFRQAGFGYTGDGGQSWMFPGTLDPGIFGSDPVLGVGPDSEFYYLTINVEKTRLFRSTDGGMTWPTYSVIAEGLIDKPWLAIDTTSGIGRGNVYVSGSSYFFRSTDRGWTFPDRLDGGLQPTLYIGFDGTLYMLSNHFAAILEISENAANPLEWPIFLPRQLVPLGNVPDQGGEPNPGGLIAQAWVATDHSGTEFHGNVYALSSALNGNYGVDVRFARSEDGGHTWSDSVRVDDDQPGNDAYQWFAMMSVAPNGRIDAAWNDTRNSDDLKLSELYYSYSTDGGRTWAPNVPVSQPFNTWVGFPQNNKIGDYYHMHSDNLGVNIAYAATFNNEQDIYFLRIGPYDCNGNQAADETDIADETSLDCNENGVPDECEYRADYDGDGLTTLADYFEFVRCQQKPRPPIQPDPYRSDGAGWARPTLRDLSDAKHGEPADLYAARGDLGCCGLFDIEPDGDIDLSDFSFLQRAFNGP